MAEEQSGEGEFKGSGDFGEFLNRLQARARAGARLARSPRPRAVEVLGRVDVGQASIDTRLSSVEASLSSVEAGKKSLRTEFLGELSKTRSDIMGKVADLTGEVTAIRDDISVDSGAVLRF